MGGGSPPARPGGGGGPRPGAGGAAGAALGGCGGCLVTGGGGFLRWPPGDGGAFDPPLSRTEELISLLVFLQHVKLTV